MKIQKNRVDTLIRNNRWGWLLFLDKAGNKH